MMIRMRQDYEVRKELKRLQAIRGAGTELISIYVPPDFPIFEEVNKLRNEHSQSGNIKSKSTRLNVQGAIDKIIQYLKVFKNLPPNGIAVFCGNISNEQAKTDIELFSIEPPDPIKSNIYRCDSTFLLEPIEAMLEAKDSYCLVVMDGRDATVATLKGSHVNVEKKLRSFAHAKVRKGGQSANRYERAIEESINDYFKSVGDAVNDVFTKYSFKLKGVIVGGPGPTKENFVKAKELNYQIKVMGTFDTGYTDEHMGIMELLEKSKEMLVQEVVTQERKVMDRFLSEISHSGLATSGYERVKRALESKNIVRLIISEDVELRKAKYKCTLCGSELDFIEEGNQRNERHESDGGKLEMLKQEDAVEELLDIAEKNGIEVSFISGESNYGRELILGFHGIAAMLKYKA